MILCLALHLIEDEEHKIYYIGLGRSMIFIKHLRKNNAALEIVIHSASTSGLVYSAMALLHC